MNKVKRSLRRKKRIAGGAKTIVPGTAPSSNIFSHAKFKTQRMNKQIPASVQGKAIAKKMWPLPAPLTTLLVGPPSCLRSIAGTLRKRNRAYRIERIEFKNYNSIWKGHRGIGLRVAIDTYESLFQSVANA